MTSIECEHCVIGAGPAGLSIAMILAKSGRTVHIFEKRKIDDFLDVNFSVKVGYNLVVTNRAYKIWERALPNALDIIKKYSVPSSGMFMHAGKTLLKTIKYSPLEPNPMVIPRNGLVTGLYECAKQFENITFHFDHYLESVDFEHRIVKFSHPSGEKSVSGGRVYACDGANSKFRRQYLAYPNSGFTCPMNQSKVLIRVLHSQKPEKELTDSWGEPGIHFALNTTMPFLCASNADFSFKILTPIIMNSPAYNELFTETPTDQQVQRLKELTQEFLPTFPCKIPDSEFRKWFKRQYFRRIYTWPNKMNVDDWAVMLGDAVHAMDPIGGQGCNSSVADVGVLHDMAEELGWENPELFGKFSDKRLPDIQTFQRAIYEMGEFMFSTNSIVRLFGILQFAGTMLICGSCCKPCFGAPFMQSMLEESSESLGSKAIRHNCQVFAVKMMVMTILVSLIAFMLFHII